MNTCLKHFSIVLWLFLRAPVFVGKIYSEKMNKINLKMTKAMARRKKRAQHPDKIVEREYYDKWCLEHSKTPTSES